MFRNTGYRPRPANPQSEDEADLSFMRNIRATISANPDDRGRSQSTVNETEEQIAARLGSFVTISVEMVSDPLQPAYAGNAASKAFWESGVRIKVRQVRWADLAQMPLDQVLTSALAQKETFSALFDSVSEQKVIGRCLLTEGTVVLTCVTGCPSNGFVHHLPRQNCIFHRNANHSRCYHPGDLQRLSQKCLRTNASEEGRGSRG